jgi:hypothetical protein
VIGRALSDEDIEAIAERVAAKIGAPARTFALLDARELADQLGVSVDYVYRHKVELGAMALGDGPRARLKFDVDRARQVLEARRRALGHRRR